MERKLGKVGWWDRLTHLTCTIQTQICPFGHPSVHPSIHLMVLLLLLLLCLFVPSCATDDADMLGSHDLKYTLTCALRYEGRKFVVVFFSSFRSFCFQPEIKNKTQRNTKPKKKSKTTHTQMPPNPTVRLR
jgi:hypothetical protein